MSLKMNNDLDRVAYLIIFVFYKYLSVLPIFPIMNIHCIVYPAKWCQRNTGAKIVGFAIKVWV